MRFRLLALDLDNTFVHSLSGAVHPCDVSAIMDCARKGIEVVLISSRPPRCMRPYWLMLGLKTHGIGYNGGVVWNFSKNLPLMGWYIQQEKLSCALEIIKKKRDTFVWLESEDKWITERLDAMPVQVHLSRGGDPTAVGDVKAWIDRPINKIIVYGDNRLSIIEPIQKIGLSVMCHSYPGIVEVRPRNVSKGAALSRICQLLDVRSENIVCIGDDLSDLPMFAIAGLSIAMGNASNAVKKTADTITLPIEHQGVSAALHRFILSR